MNYDVCLSFAGEDRACVKAVADALRLRAVRVFYDEYERAELWGKGLYSHLDEVYRRSARYRVLFVSEFWADPGSIDDRAATIFLLVTGQLTEAQTLDFLAVLRTHQITDGRIPIRRLVPAPPRSVVRPCLTVQLEQCTTARGRRELSRVSHRRRRLHIPARYTRARQKAVPILDGSRDYLTRTLTSHRGRLVNLVGEVTPLTPYGYAVCPALSLPLPPDWRAVAADLLAMGARVAVKHIDLELPADDLL